MGDQRRRPERRRRSSPASPPAGARGARGTSGTSGGFGSRLRELRISKRLTMSAAARALGVSVPYWSDVENGRRNPFTGAKLLSAARILGADLDELERLAFAQRGSVEIPLAHRSPRRADLIVSFARTVDELGDAELEAIERILERRSGDDPA